MESSENSSGGARGPLNQPLHFLRLSPHDEACSLLINYFLSICLLKKKGNQIVICSHRFNLHIFTILPKSAKTTATTK